MKIFYTTDSSCKIEDLLKCVPELEITSQRVEINKNTDWKELFNQVKIPILHQKNFIEIEDNKIDIKKMLKNFWVVVQIMILPDIYQT